MLIATMMPTFSWVRICSFIIMGHGMMARRKSINAEYAVVTVSRPIDRLMSRVSIPAAAMVTPRMRSLFQHVPSAPPSHIFLAGWHCSHRSTMLTHVTTFMDVMIIKSAILSFGPAILVSVIAKEVLLHIAAIKKRVPV